MVLCAVRRRELEREEFRSVHVGGEKDKVQGRVV